MKLIICIKFKVLAIIFGGPDNAEYAKIYSTACVLFNNHHKEYSRTLFLEENQSKYHVAIVYPLLIVFPLITSRNFLLDRIIN